MDWKPEGDPVEAGKAARRAERRPHANQLHDVSPMSCMSATNHDARDKDQGRPRPGQALAPRDRARPEAAGPARTLLAQPRGAGAPRRGARRARTSSRPARPSSTASRGAASCSCWASRRRSPRVGAACRKPNEKIVPFVRRPEEVTPGNPLHFATAYGARRLRERPPRREPRGAPDQDRGQPGSPRDAGRDDAVRAGADPRPLRRRPRQAAPARRRADRLARASSRRSRRYAARLRPPAARGCAS